MTEPTFTIHNGNCIEVMRSMADNSLDSIVTDPPYELGFMGKSWDSTGIAFNVEVWTEALRVLKPGGHLLAFSGSRTYHRMAVAIEDAGFQIRDQIMWVYGSGFPKSLDISKAIDKAAGSKRGKIKHKPRPETSGTMSGSGDSRPWIELARQQGFYETDNNIPVSFEAVTWQGWGTALKPAHEPIVLARKPLIGTVAANVLEYGTGGLNIDGSRVGSDELGGGTMPDLRDIGAMSKEAIGIDKLSFGQNLRPAQRIEQPTYTGRFPANFIHDGSHEVLAGFPDSKGGHWPHIKTTGFSEFGGGSSEYFGVGPKDTMEGSAARFFYCAKASKRDRNEGLDGFEGQSIGAKGNGLARVCATCNASTIQGCECPDRTYVNPTRQNHHPTVKPTDLMRYLVKLITPPNGTVLDPFTGSGSTGKGAVIEGFNFIGIELDPDYVAIATARIQHQLDNIEPTLFTEETS
jgi:site-specific DNA-methyltransferase (adenine-specific)